MTRMSLKQLLLVLLVSVALGSAQPGPPSAMDHFRRALHLADLNNWNGAAEDFSAAEKMFNDAGDRRNALYARLGKIRATVSQRDLSATSAQLATDLEENPLLKSDNELRMFCLIVKGDIDGEIDSGATRRDWDEVQKLARGLGDVKWQYRSLGQLGLAAFYDGDLETARKNVASALIAATNGGDSGAEIRFLTAAGIGLREGHMYSAAMEYFDKALKVASSTPEAGYPFLTKEARLEVLIDMGQTDAARRLADEIMNEARERNLPTHQIGVIALLAHVAENRKDTESAERLFNQVLGLAKQSGLVRERADAGLALAEIYRARGDVDRAEQFASMSVTATEESGNAWAVPQCLRTLAEIEVGRGQFVKADETYDRASTMIDGLLGKYSGLLEKTALIKASSELYRQHFSLIASRFHDPAKAYGILEQVRGRVMTDLLLAGSAASEDARKEQRSLSELRLKLMAARSLAEAHRLRDQIFLAQQTLWVTPEINILKSESHKSIAIQEVQRALNPSATILEYVLAEPKSYCLVISRWRAHFFALSGEQQIRLRALAYLKAVKAKEAAIPEAHHLYESLIAPIPEVDKKADLIIIRDGVLHLLPFDAFVDGAGHYLVENHTIVYSPSATAFALLSNQRSRPGPFRHQLLAVGGIPYDRGELKQVAVTRGYDDGGLSDLPASRDEVMNAEAALHSRGNVLLLGTKATETAFKRAPLDQYRILHLAVHGFASPTDASQSALVLLSDRLAGEDGLLHAAEIVQLRLKAALAILSACDTAVGPVQGEEGIETLSRAFLLAGARNVISTLWSVDDTFSLYLMKQFYQHLAENKPAATALTTAKREMLRKYHSTAVPYYWAGYTIEGAFDGATTQDGSQGMPNVTHLKAAN